MFVRTFDGQVAVCGEDLPVGPVGQCLRSIPKCIAEPVERGHGQPVASVIPKD